MKWYSLVFFAGFLFGCGPDSNAPDQSDTEALEGLDIDDPQVVKTLVEKAINEEILQKRGKKTQELYYEVNMEQPYTGWIKTLYDDGLICSLFEVRDGKNYGQRFHFFDSGRKALETGYKDGERHGKHVEWDPSGGGKKWLEGAYLNGEKHGVFRRWSGGVQLFEKQYEYGKLHGISTEFFPSENGAGKMSEEEYKNGKLHGRVVRWHSNGQNKVKEQYEDGKRQGSFSSWHENGQKSVQAEYRNDELNGPYTSWYANGQKQVLALFEDGREQELVVSYYESGQKQYEARYENGKVQGMEVSWYENGQRKSELERSKDKHVAGKVWLPDGSSCTKSNLKNGSGFLVNYDGEGNVEEGYEYKDGVLFKLYWYSDDGKVTEMVEHHDGEPLRSESYDLNGEVTKVYEMKDGEWEQRPLEPPN